MRRYFLIALLLAIVAAPAFAGARLCNATLASATCSNVCNAAGDGLLYFSISRTDPDGAGPLVSLSDELSAALCATFNYQTTVAGGGANPESCASFAERMIRDRFREWLANYRERQEEVKKQAAIAANPAPAID